LEQNKVLFHKEWYCTNFPKCSSSTRYYVFFIQYAAFCGNCVYFDKKHVS